MRKKSAQQKSTGNAESPDVFLGFIDRLEAIGNHGIWIVLSITGLILTYVFWDFFTGAKVLLYKDIGSDSINIFYPIYRQFATLWNDHGTTSGYVLNYTMGQDLGFNAFDIFSWILVQGGPDNVAGNIAHAEAAKMILSTVLGYFFFRYQGISNLVSSVGALCIGFSGFIVLTSSGWYYQSHEAFYFILAIWATEYSIQRKPFYYVILPLAIALVTQVAGFFFIYTMATLIAYCVFKSVLAHNQRIPSWTAGLVTVGLIVVGLGVSHNTVMDTIDTLQNSGRAESIKQSKAVSVYGTDTKVSMFDLAPKRDYANIVLRAYNNNLMGTGNGFRGMMNYLEAPLLYYGLPMLFFIPFLFVGQDRKTKIAYAVLVGLALMMLIFPWFRFAFWNFQLDYFREFTMLLGFVLLFVAIHGLEQLTKTTSKTFTWLTPLVVLLVLALPFMVSKSAGYIDPAVKTTVVLVIIGYAVALLTYVVTRNQLALAAVLLLTVLDLTSNANTTINKRDLLSTREIEQGALYGGASLKAIDWIKSKDRDLYRVVKFTASGPTMHSSLNDAMVQGFNGIVGYSSFHNKYYLRFMEKLGCRDPRNPNDAKWVYKAITRPYLASMLGAKYFISNDRPMGFDDQLFPLTKQIDNVFIHESKTALPLVIAYDSYVTEDEFATQQSGRNDYMLYRAAIIGKVNEGMLGSTPHYDLQSDTIRNVRTIDFAKAADERRAMLQAKVKPTLSGLEGTISLQRDGIVVVQIPYSEGMSVTVDGKPVKTFVANFGFLGFRCKAVSAKMIVKV
jgi:uncharacterized membrane protein YfhO